MISPPQMPSDHLGIRLSVCGTLVLLVGCFFVAYDGLAHRGTPTVSGIQPTSYRVSNHALRQTSWDNIPAPDMKSQDVTFANADVPTSPKAQPVVKLKPPGPANAPNKPAAVAHTHHIRTAQLRSAKPAELRPTQTAKIRIRQDGRAAFAQSFFGSAPFNGF
jgi:hypothetical protein